MARTRHILDWWQPQIGHTVMVRRIAQQVGLQSVAREAVMTKRLDRRQLHNQLHSGPGC